MRFWLVILSVCIFHSANAELKPMGMDDLDIHMQGLTFDKSKTVEHRFSFTSGFNLGPSVNSTKNCKRFGWKRQPGSFFECWNNQSKEFVSKVGLAVKNKKYQNENITVSFTLEPQGTLSNIKVYGVDKNRAVEKQLANLLKDMSFGQASTQKSYAMGLTIYSNIKD